jgi:YidC/Oxa1 family membrane protein insertase
MLSQVQYSMAVQDIRYYLNGLLMQAEGDQLRLVATDGSSYLNHTYTGPMVYTPEGKFEKVSFGDLDDDFKSGRDQADYVRRTDSGWVGMTQHYFMATWILQPKNGVSVCGTTPCQIDIKRRDSDNLYSAGVRVPLTAVAPNTIKKFNINLYVGPQTYSVITKVADNLNLAKDYGKVHIFASPLFWLLDKLHGFVNNWGWAIVLLTIIVKIVLSPLTNASYRSMAKMRAVAPRLETLKKQHGDDRMALQQAMMKMYKDEKINPLGGCLPMLLQIPVFIGLYWALFASVELRQAPWIGWIHDLGRTDPYFILPIIMTLTMFIQTSLNPAPTDPMQAKMMKIMPLIFSVMFFFFPAGLVLYWVVNNIITIGQQWYINKSVERKRKTGVVVS